MSIDGLQPEHDARRGPATYDRILRNIAGQGVTIHCTVTGQMMKRPGYLGEIKKVWFSLFTPQDGDQMPEILSSDERQRAITAMAGLRKQYPKLDMPEVVISPICFATAEPSGLRIRTRDPDLIGRPENKDHSMPVRRKSGMLIVRMHCIDGPGIHCCS